MVELLFEDIFTVTRLDPDGKKFDKVSRIEARSEQFDMYMQLDVNIELYPLHVGEKFTMVLASTLNFDGTPDTGYYVQVSPFSSSVAGVHFFSTSILLQWRQLISSSRTVAGWQHLFWPRRREIDFFFSFGRATDFFFSFDVLCFVCLFGSQAVAAALSFSLAWKGQKKSLADKYEYVMHGKLFKISEESAGGPNVKVEIYVSFGGLLMLLKGDPSNAANFELDQRLFLLMRKV